MTTSPAPAQQFVALAGLRGVAALALLQYHTQGYLFGPLLPGGYLAVDFFFVLSGWVLAHAYDRRLQSGMTGWQFMRIRLIRLYPVYLLAFVMTVGGWFVGGQLILPGPLLGLLFLPDLLAVGAPWVVGPFWSLSAELCANLPFGFLHSKLTTPVLLSALLLALAGLTWWTFAGGSLTGNTLDIGFSIATRWGMFPRVFFSFPLGMLLYRHRARLAAWAPRWATWPAVGLLMAALAVPAAGPIGALSHLPVVIILLPLVVLLAANAAPGPRTARLAQVLGAISYPLYLIQIPIIEGADVLAQAAHAGGIASLPMTITLPLVIAIIALAWAIDRYFDQPVRRWLNRPAEPGLVMLPAIPAE